MASGTCNKSVRFAKTGGFRGDLESTAVEKSNREEGECEKGTASPLYRNDGRRDNFFFFFFPLSLSLSFLLFYFLFFIFYFYFYFAFFFFPLSFFLFFLFFGFYLPTSSRQRRLYEGPSYSVAAEREESRSTGTDLLCKEGLRTGTLGRGNTAESWDAAGDNRAATEQQQSSQRRGEQNT